MMRKTLHLTNAEVGKVIGVRGAVVKTIRQTSGASVEIEHGSADDRPVHLSGEPSQVETAERLIWCASALSKRHPHAQALSPATHTLTMVFLGCAHAGTRSRLMTSTSSEMKSSRRRPPRP